VLRSSEIPDLCSVSGIKNGTSLRRSFSRENKITPAEEADAIFKAKKQINKRRATPSI